MSKIAIVVPTIREDQMTKWVAAWDNLIEGHKADLFIVWDNSDPSKVYIEQVYRMGQADFGGTKYFYDLVSSNRDLFETGSPACRNIAFYWIAKADRHDYIMTFDDDTLPIGDPIQDHIDALNMRVSTRWMNTVVDMPMRGLPYNTRAEAQVVVSHGVWEGVPDLDAPNQLVKGAEHKGIEFVKGVVPYGVYMPFCFLPDQEVQMADGTRKKIVNIEKGDVVLTENGEAHPVIKKLDRNVGEDIYTIKIQGEPIKVKVTANHEFLVSRKLPKSFLFESPTWIPAKDIKIGDYVLYPRKKQSIFKFTPEESYIFGLFAAEGNYLKCSNCKNGLSGLAFSIDVSKRNTIGKRVDYFFEDYFNKTPTWYSNTGNGIRCEIYGTQMAEYFYYHIGEYSDQKQFSTEVMERADRFSLLRGLFDGDGTIGFNKNRPRVSYKSTSLDLIYQIKSLIMGLGHFASLHIEKHRLDRKQAYSLTIYGDKAQEFAEQILGSDKYANHEKTLEKPQRSHIVLSDYVGSRVQSISTSLYCGPVYNITVEDNHTYVVSGALVKNCGMNVAFHRSVLPLMYWMPSQTHGFPRFDDIWLGVHLVEELKHDQAIVTGYAKVEHSRASNVFTNLQKEAPGIELHESYWQCGITDNCRLHDGAINLRVELLRKYKDYQKLIKMANIPF